MEEQGTDHTLVETVEIPVELLETIARIVDCRCQQCLDQSDRTDLDYVERELHSYWRERLGEAREAKKQVTAILDSRAR